MLEDGLAATWRRLNQKRTRGPTFLSPRARGCRGSFDKPVRTLLRSTDRMPRLPACYWREPQRPTLWMPVWWTVRAGLNRPSSPAGQAISGGSLPTCGWWSV
jgi:hypothetical protein